MGHQVAPGPPSGVVHSKVADGKEDTLWVTPAANVQFDIDLQRVQALLDEIGYTGLDLPAELTTKGEMQFCIRKEAGSNAVISEIWLEKIK